jgi:hypothetical protein
VHGRLCLHQLPQHKRARGGAYRPRARSTHSSRATGDANACALFEAAAPIARIAGWSRETGAPFKPGKLPLWFNGRLGKQGRGGGGHVHLVDSH